MKKAFDFVVARFGEAGTWAGLAAASATIPQLQYLTFLCTAVAVVLKG